MRGALMLVVAVLVAAVAGAPAAAAEFTPDGEAANYAKIRERAQYEHGTPEYRALMQERGIESELELNDIRLNDPERDMSGNLCRSHYDGCAGDIRLWPKHWAAEGHGITRPVLFTARNGAVLSGHVWATRSGPALRPAVVITSGSIQAPEELYVFAATTLAKAGYVVLTYDVQGQGRSDTYGEGVDRDEGFPSQAGQPFYDGTEDALDFMLSTPASPYRPRRSCSTGTSHEEKQLRRVRAGLNAAYNPLSELVDPRRVGVAGHSLGAAAVSYVGQLDARVKAIVAWDNLRDSSAGIAASACPSGASPRPERIALTKPALGMSNDYSLTPTPYSAAPDEQAKNAASNGYSAAGVDSAQLNIRGGTHFEYAYIPNPGFGATLRGMDMAAWYMQAWFDRYVKGGVDEDAERRLRTTRWRADARGAEVDPAGDGNLFSHYLKSRLAIGGFRCEDMRTGCAGLSADDGRPPNYSYYDVAKTADDGAVTPAAADFDGTAEVTVTKAAETSGADGSFPVRVRAVARREEADHFELQVSRYSPRRAGAYRTIAGQLGAAPHVFRGALGATYRFRARAVSRGGAAGPWSRAAITMVPFDAAPGRVKFGRGWSSVSDARAWNGSFRRTTRAGATMAFRWRGSILHLVGRRSPAGGRAWLYVDGRRRSISFRSRKVRNRTLIWAEKVSGRGTHTMRIVTRGGRAEVDGIGVAP
ncbi:MAG TPA: hypothetical protein VF517_09420 [Thermoleophilaceae bacterium]